MVRNGAESVRSRGKVVLIGAGPGDLELLTIKAAKALARADVVMLDDLVNPEIREYCRADARIVHVGKRGGCRSTPQDFINRLMARYARQGLLVARVKGGDPFIFGRGGEEKTFLETQGVEVEVLNGLTAGLVAASQIGVPLTDRRHCRGVTLITAHTKEGGTPDWHALAQTGTTLVIYMGVKQLPLVVAGLREGGMRADMPVAMIENASRPERRELVTTLAEVEREALLHEIQAPAVIVVGGVVSEAAFTGLQVPAEAALFAGLDVATDYRALAGVI